ncbi:MAG: sugar phosphate nucleotidyltransferase [Patescibacteria group bacterium]
MRHAVIMAGGTGTRLWPVSRQATPKQFQNLIGNQSLLQQTYARLSGIFPPERVWVVVGEQHQALVSQQLPELPAQNIIAEPCGRNTAAATLLAALTIQHQDPDAVLFGLVPADHYIGKPEVFQKTTDAALCFLDTHPEYAVTIGIHPTEPNTGLGYIKVGERLEKIAGKTVAKADSFHEKPNQKMAEQFVASGDYVWNGGYYLFTAGQMIEYFRQLAPAISSGVEKYLHDQTHENYAAIPSQSIDTAIAEKLDKLAVIAVEMEWSDVGNWAALHEILASIGQSSQVVTGDHIGNNSDNSLIMGGNKLIVTVGVNNIVVVETDDVILICDKGSVQDVKKIVEQLQEQGRGHLL